MRLRRLVFAIPALVILATGCQATGGGAIPSATVPGDKATFGFVFSASVTSEDFSGSYHDPQGIALGGVVDIAFRGSGGLQKCTPGVDPTCAKAPANAKGGCIGGLAVPYTSQNPNFPGTGTFDILLCDLDGTGGGGQDFMLISIDSGPCSVAGVDACPLPGPYTGYGNTGTPSGNITVRQ